MRNILLPSLFVSLCLSLEILNTDQCTNAAYAVEPLNFPLHGMSQITPDNSDSPNLKPKGTILRGGLFETGSVNNLQTIDIEGVRSTVKFLKSLSSQQMMQTSVFQNPFSVTLDKAHFMGEPLIAKLSNQENSAGTKNVDPSQDNRRRSGSYDYYLIIFHFNVPAVKYSVIPTRYGFARFSFNLQVFSPIDNGNPKITASSSKIAKQYKEAGCKFSSKEIQSAVGANAIWPVRVISLYPVNEVLTITREDTNQFEAQFKPEFQGGSTGSLTYTKTLKDSFAFDLPKVIGTGSSAGTVSWTYYPEKAQPLMLGSKTTMAIIAVPAGLNYKNLALRVFAEFNYQLTKAKLPLWWGQSAYDAKQVSLVNVPSLKEVTALHSIDLPKDIRNTVSDVFKTDIKEKPKVVLIKGKDSDYLMDPDSGAIYLPNGGAWKAIELNPPPQNSSPAGN